MTVTVITGTMLPERTALLAEAVASVAAQTHKPTEHLIGVDYQRRGGARMLNLLVAAVQTEWLAILNDDDVLYSQHLERLLAAEADADVVYSYCDADDGFPNYNQGFDAGLLRLSSIVSHNALIRTELVRRVGGWDEGAGYDWRFWHKALDVGARFVCVPERTWLYRLDPTWWHESRPWTGVA